jgi:hypothetical protein
MTADVHSVQVTVSTPRSQLLGVNPCDWWGVDKLCDAAGDAAQSVGTNILGSIATGIAGLALGFLKMIWGLIEGTTSPDTNGEFLYEWAGRLFAISLVITVGFMCLQAITALARRQGSVGVLRAVWGAGIAILATTISLPVIHAFTTALDAIADNFAAITFGDLDSMIDRYDHWLHADDGEDSQWAQVVGGAFGATAASLGLIFLGWLILLAGFAVWGALLIRSMLLYVFAVTAPIAIMGLVWDKTSAWFTRWVSGLTAIMFTKLGVMVVFGLGVSMLDSLDFGDDVEGAFGVLFSGVLMMAMAALVPIVAFKFFSFIGDETAAAFHHRDAETGAAAGNRHGTPGPRFRVSWRVDRAANSLEPTAAPAGQAMDHSCPHSRLGAAGRQVGVRARTAAAPAGSRPVAPVRAARPQHRGHPRERRARRAVHRAVLPGPVRLVRVWRLPRPWSFPRATGKRPRSAEAPLKAPATRPAPPAAGRDRRATSPRPAATPTEVHR